MRAYSGNELSTRPALKADCVYGKKHFAYSLNFYKIFWIFIFGSFIGYVAETAWAFLIDGRYICRSSLLYGPVNTVYGIGAVVLFLSLYKISKENKLYIFIVGTITGTAVEYACSYVQELIFGTVSWDYSQTMFNINGRVCLIYSFFWGILALTWVYFLYPRFEMLISGIPDSLGRKLTWCLLALLLFDVLISVIAVTRWVTRIEGIPAFNNFVQAIDFYYPNTKMEYIYSNMKFLIPGLQR